MSSALHSVLFVVLFVICAAVTAVVVAAPGGQRAVDPAQRYAVRYVVDGDTIDLAGAGRVRLLGIDAPELGAGLDTAAPFAVEARDLLRSLLAGRWVRIETDVERYDRYSRLLAYVVREDGMLVNAEVLRLGLAHVSARAPLRRLTELQRAEAEAQRLRRGMWGDRPAIPGPTFRVPRP